MQLPRGRRVQQGNSANDGELNTSGVNSKPTLKIRAMVYVPATAIDQREFPLDDELDARTI